MPDKVTLYDIVKKWLPEEKFTMGMPVKSGAQTKHIADIGFNACLFNIKQRLEKIEVSEEGILQELVYVSWSLHRDGKNNLRGKEQLKIAAQAILNYLGELK